MLVIQTKDGSSHINISTDSQAFGLLNTILVSGISQPNSRQSLPTFAPTSQCLSLAGTLVVHPSQTTRAAPADANRAANDALRLLRQVNQIVGPVNADFATALAFSPSEKGRLRTWRNTNKQKPSSGDFDDSGINTDIATRGSIWQCAEDFWHVVGWAFNCSAAWKKRWERWELWLDFMLDVLNGDFDERQRQAKVARNGHDAQELLKESLVLQYLLSCDTHTARRRVMRAIFANGTVKSMNEFKHVFRNETKERKSEETKFADRKAKKLNIDEGEFADYIDDEDEEEADELTADIDALTGKDSIRVTANAGRQSSHDGFESSSDESDWSRTDATKEVDKLGGMGAILIRQRLLALVCLLLAPQSCTTVQLIPVCSLSKLQS